MKNPFQSRWAGWLGGGRDFRAGPRLGLPFGTVRFPAGRPGSPRSRREVSEVSGRHESRQSEGLAPPGQAAASLHP